MKMYEVEILLEPRKDGNNEVTISQGENTFIALSIEQLPRVIAEFRRIVKENG